jgi:hypothetical protein
MSSFKYPVLGGSGTGGSAYWADAVANVASLPASGAVIGEVRLVLDLNKFYEWNGASWVLTGGSVYWGDAVASVAALPASGVVSGEVRLAIAENALYRWSGSAWVAIGVPIVLTSQVSGILPVANGGTNSSTALSNGRVIKSLGGSLVEAAAITASRALESDASGIPVASTVTNTELGYVSGVTSAIQTQISGKEPTITTLSVAKGGTNSGTALSNNRVIVSNTGAIVEAAAITASRALESNASGIPIASTVTSTELGYVSGVTSAIQTQISGKEPTITTLSVAKGGTNSGTALSNNRVIISSAGAIVETTAITASRALASDASGIPVASTVTSTELGYVSGVTSAIQTQITGKASVQTVVSVSSNITLANYGIYLVDTTAARSLQLPSPVAGALITVKDKTGTSTANNITILRAGSEKIETVAASYLLREDLGSWSFVTDGTDWYIC